MKQRINYFDVARGIAILCIIAGHSGNSAVVRLTFTFHVPVFFLISGYFFKAGKMKGTTGKLLKPYVFTSVLITILQAGKQLVKGIILWKEPNIDGILFQLKKGILAGLYGSGSRQDFLSLRLPVVGAIWFFLALIWAELLLNMLLKPGKNVWVVGIGTAALWLVGFFTAKLTWLPLSIQAGMCGLVFLVTGYAVREKNLKSYFNKPMIAVASGIIWAGAIAMSFLNLNMSMVKCQFPNPIMNILGAIAATYLLLILGQKIERTKLGKFLAWCGRNSMIILSMHLIEMEVIPWRDAARYLGVNVSSVPVLIGILLLKLLFILSGVLIAHKLRCLKWVYSLA